MDFETVAAHEIGHLLGFVSLVDEIDYYMSHAQTVSTLSPYPLDLYRFASGSAPGSAAAFSTAPRNFVPGGTKVFSDTALSYSLSTGLTQGDGRQASHWKDDALTSSYIGIMDPTLAYGVTEAISAADIRAMSLIGYDLVAPEPGTITLLFSGALLLVARRRRK
jgi:hypothetical protein